MGTLVKSNREGVDIYRDVLEPYEEPGMKSFAFASLVAALTIGLAHAQMGNPIAGLDHPEHLETCANNNSKHCQDARKAFAEHHNGMSPEQWEKTHPGHREHWEQNGKNSALEGSNGEQHRKGRDKSEYVEQHVHRRVEQRVHHKDQGPH
jgi:hypothetical protein